MPNSFTEEQKQQILALADTLPSDEQEALLQSVRSASYASDAVKVSYDSELRPYIDQWVDKVKGGKGYRAQMWVVNHLAGLVQGLIASVFGVQAVSAISDYTKAMDELRPAFQAAKQKIESDPKGAVDDMVGAFDTFHDAHGGYFNKLFSLYPAGYLQAIASGINPYTSWLYGAGSAVGWLAYKRLMGKAVKEAKKLQQSGAPAPTQDQQAGEEPAAAADLQSWSDRKRGEGKQPVSPSVQREFARMFGDDEAAAPPVPLTQKKQKPRRREPQIPSTTRPVEPPSPSGSRFSFDQKALRRLLSGA